MSKYKQIKIFPKNTANLSSVRQEIDNLAQDKLAKMGMRIGFSCLGLSLVILGVSVRKLPPEVPLWFSRPYGEEQLVSMWALALIPLISFLFQALSIRSAGRVLEEDNLMTQILVWSGSLVSLMGLITVIMIVRLVT